MQSYKANEVRLNRSLEELEKLRTIMHNYEHDGKELRDVTRRKSDELAAVVKRLEKQKSGLLIGFKKQMQLIDNLKKQKVSENVYDWVRTNHLSGKTEENTRNNQLGDFYLCTLKVIFMDMKIVYHCLFQYMYFVY